MARLDHAQPRAGMSIPRGVGAPPPPGLDPKRGKLMCIKVRMLDDSIAVFHLGHKALGQQLLDEVSRHLNLLESDYFGLEYFDETKTRCWLEKEKPVLRQVAAAGGNCKFFFIVKFYTPNPVDLEEEYTRYLFTLQVRRDLAFGELHCAESTAALLAAYLVQSDCGDFSAEDYPDASYLSHTRFVPNQTMAFQQLVMSNHKNLEGMSPAQSDLALLEVARRCDFYGVKLHPARDADDVPGHLSVLHLGIRQYQQLQCISTFSWGKIRKLSFKRKKLLIKLHPDSYYAKETAEFSFETRNECKNFWKKCVEHHAFFRCTAAENLRRDHHFFSKGSSFRFTGRTQKQLIDYVREHHKRREPFTRPLRSATSQRSYVAGTIISDRQRNGRTHASMPHLPPSTQEALDARSKRRDRCISDIDTNDRQRKSPRREIDKREQESMSLSLPNVLDELPVVCDIPLDTQPPKSTSGDNFNAMRDFDALSEDSYGLSDNERSARSDVGVSSSRPQVYNTTFTAKRVGNVIVKRVVSKSTPCTDDEESEGPNRRKLKEFPFRHTTMVPIEIDGPNVDKQKVVYTPSGTLLRKPRVISVDEDGYDVIKVSPDSGHYSTLFSPPSTSKGEPEIRSSRSPESGQMVPIMTPSRSFEDSTLPYAVPIKKRETPSQEKEEKKDPVTYGAVGPLPGKVLTKENVIVTPEGIKERQSRGPKPAVPPKPKVPAHQATPIVHMEDSIVKREVERSKSEEPEKPPPRTSQLSRPALISVSSEDHPEIQKCHLFNSEIPYTLTLRHVGETGSLKRNTGSPEVFKRRKSLDLVPRKRLPSPGNFSSQDHTVEPMTPDGDVLEYLLRRRSMSHERSALKGKRGDPRRMTQPVRFDLPPSPCSTTKGGSNPFISFLSDDVAYDTVSESRSLHDGMDRLEKNDDSEDSDPLPPPPPAVSEQRPLKIPPLPPPKPKEVAQRVVEIKASAELSLVSSDSPPFIDDSPKDSEKSSEQGAGDADATQYQPRKKEVIYGVNSTFSAENLSEPAQMLKSALSISVNSDRMTRAESSESGGFSLYQQSERHASRSLDDLDPETSSEQSESYLEREDSLVGRRGLGKWQNCLPQIIKDLEDQERTAYRDVCLVSQKLYEVVEPQLEKCRVLAEMFHALEELRQTQKTLLDELAELIQSFRWDDVPSILLLRNAHNTIPIYISLLQQFPIFLSALDELSRQNGVFRSQLLQLESTEECYLPMNWLLLRVTHRIVAWQPVLARIVECQLDEGKEEKDILSARVTLDKVSQYAEKTKRQRHSLAEFVAMLQVEKDLGRPGLLSHPHRRLLRLGWIERWSQNGTNSRLLLLTTDRLLFAHRTAGETPFSIHAEIKLKGLLIEDGDTYGVTGKENVVTLHSGDKSIVMMTPNREEWVEDISNSVKQAAKARLELPPLQLDKRDENEILQLQNNKEDPLKSKPSPLQVCWQRRCSIGVKDLHKIVSNGHSGYLLRKLRNSSGWQRLFVVMAGHSLFFYKSHEDSAPLASLSLVDYGLGIPTLEDAVSHENCFKLFYGSYKYYFRTENDYSFRRWMDAIKNSAISRKNVDLVTALSLRI